MNITCNRQDGVTYGYAMYLTGAETEVVRRALVKYLMSSTVTVEEFKIADALKTEIFKAYIEEVV